MRTFLNDRRLDGILTGGAEIPANEAELRDFLYHAGFTERDVNRHYAVWELLATALTSDRNMAVLRSAKSCPEAYLDLCKLYTADTQGSKVHCVRRAFSSRMKKNEDLIIAVDNIISCVAELAENDVGLDELLYIHLIDNPTARLRPRERAFAGANSESHPRGSCCCP